MKPNKLIALVYMGASFLILIVGLRALVQAGAFGDISEGFLNIVTIFALGAEFILLFLYGLSMFKDGDSLATSNESVNSLMDISDESVDSLVKSLSSNNKLLKEYNSNLADICTKLDEIASDEMSKKITEETRKILQKSLDNLK